MRRFRIVLIIILFIICFLVVQKSFIAEVRADIDIIDPSFSEVPKIDGHINRSANEWAGAIKRSEVLYPNGSQNGLDIELWVLQNQTNLYFLVQFELEEHSNVEFLGLLFSDEEDITEIDEDDYTDLKLVQLNLSQTVNETYLDLHLNGSIYSEDSSVEGYGAASVENKRSIYEFQIPVDNYDALNNFEDVFLEKGKPYSFKIVFGEYKLGGYKGDIELYNNFLVNVKFPPQVEPEIDWDLVLFVLTIVIFSSLALFYAIFAFKVIRMKNFNKR